MHKRVYVHVRTRSCTRSTHAHTHTHSKHTLKTHTQHTHTRTQHNHTAYWKCVELNTNFNSLIVTLIVNFEQHPLSYNLVPSFLSLAIIETAAGAPEEKNSAYLVCVFYVDHLLRRRDVSYDPWPPRQVNFFLLSVTQSLFQPWNTTERG